MKTKITYIALMIFASFSGVYSQTQYCDPCGGTVPTYTPTAGGNCFTVENNAGGCTYKFDADGACGSKVMGNSVDTRYITWIKVTVPATGEFFGTALNTTGTTDVPPVIEMYTSSGTCTYGGASNSFTQVGCAWFSTQNCPGGYDCGINGTYVNANLNSNTTGEQFYYQGTPGTTIYISIDAYANGLTAAGVGDFRICLYNDIPSANALGSAPQTCGTTVSGTTYGAFPSLSCPGKPATCGGGPAPSFENMMYYAVTSDALGSDVTVNITGITCNGSNAGVQALIYSGNTCATLACVDGNTNSGLTDKSFTFATSPNTVYTILIDGFAGALCNFNIGTSSCVVLPIELSSFGAERNDKGVALKWLTLSEKNNDHFVVHRSFDGITFNPIATLKGAGNSSVYKSYSMQDFIDYNDVIYYKLEQVDFDGKRTMANQMAVVNRQIFGKVYISPNPASSSMNINFSSENETEYTIEVNSILGAKLKSINYQSVKGNNSLSMDLTDLPNGNYFISIYDGSKIIRERFVKN